MFRSKGLILRPCSSFTGLVEGTVCNTAVRVCRTRETARVAVQLEVHAPAWARVLQHEDNSSSEEKASGRFHTQLPSKCQIELDKMESCGVACVPRSWEVHDKEMKRLAKEFQSQAKILDRPRPSSGLCWLPV